MDRIYTRKSPRSGLQTASKKTKTFFLQQQDETEIYSFGKKKVKPFILIKKERCENYKKISAAYRVFISMVCGVTVLHEGILACCKWVKEPTRTQSPTVQSCIFTKESMHTP